GRRGAKKKSPAAAPGGGGQGGFPWGKAPPAPPAGERVVRPPEALGGAMTQEPEITPEQLETFRRCTFARRVFASYPSLWAKKPLGADNLPPDPSSEGEEWHVSKPYTGEPFDP